MKTFSLLHSTARFEGPLAWFKSAEKWINTCDQRSAMEYILCVDAPTSSPIELPRSLVGICRMEIVGNDGEQTNVRCWNYAAELSTGKFLITVADDYFPPDHWDTLLLQAIPDLDGEYVLDVDNQDNSNLLSHSMLTRKYYERYGYLFHSDYEGLMSDVEFTSVAHRDGVVVNAKHLMFKHLNPDAGTAEWDAVYLKHRGPEKLLFGQRVYVARQNAGFPKESCLESL